VPEHVDEGHADEQPPTKRRRRGHGAGIAIGGIVAGIEQQIFKTTPPVEELVARGKPIPAVPAAGGGTLTVAMPGDPIEPQAEPGATDRLLLTAPGVDVVIDLAVGGRVASLRLDDHELLRTEGMGPIQYGSYPMAPYAGRIREGRFAFEGRDYTLPITMETHAIHGTVLDRPWTVVGAATPTTAEIATDLGPDWPFRGRARQRFELASDALAFELAIDADEPMPASVGWHPWFLRRAFGAESPVQVDLDAESMFVRDAAGITTPELIPTPPEPWDDCFAGVRRSPVLRWPGFLELTVESPCPFWVVYTVPEDAVCVEPQTAPPNALNGTATIVEPDHPLVATQTWRWRRPGG
jgi:aldose 1-epimerase